MYQKFLNKLKSDNKSGASEIKRYTKEFLKNLVEKGIKEEELRELLKEIRKSKPMAPLLNLCNNVERLIEEGYDKVLEFLSKKESIEDLIRNAKEELKSYKKILTYSYSGTVLEVLKNLDCEVYLSEGRPVCEGRLLAQKLLECGKKVHFCVDAYIFNLLKEVDCVVTGADAITSDYFVNKIGTYALAVMSKEFDKKFYIVAEQDKFLKSFIFHEDEKDKKEVWNVKDTNIRIYNFYFEKIPLSFVCKIITENGVYSSFPDNIL